MRSMSKLTYNNPLAVVLAVLLLVAPTPAGSETFEQGLNAMRAGDPEQARDIWMPLAEIGDAAAQYSLAKLYEKGEGTVAQDLEQAVRWYRKAADQGMPAAQNNLALMYAQGRGLPSDQRRAAELWRTSALQEYPWGQYNLGLAYFRGHGVTTDRHEAVGWFRRAADGGLAEAQFIMGQLRREGLVLEQDRGQALTWYQRATQQGHAEAIVQFDALVTAGIEPRPVDAPEFSPLGVAAAKVSDSGIGSRRAEAVAVEPEPAQNDLARNDAAQNNAAEPQAAETGATDGAERQVAAVVPDEAAESTPKPARKPKVLKVSQLTPEQEQAAKLESDSQQAIGSNQVAALPSDDTEAQNEPDNDVPWVWLASAGSRDEARELWQEMQARHGAALAEIKAIFAPVEVGDEMLYRILAGPLAGARDAAELCARLRGADINSFCQVRTN